MTGIFGVGFFPVQCHVLHNWDVLNGEENCLLLGVVGVLVPSPRWHHKEIALVPPIPGTLLAGARSVVGTGGTGAQKGSRAPGKVSPSLG